MYKDQMEALAAWSAKNKTEVSEEPVAPQTDTTEEVEQQPEATPETVAEPNDEQPEPQQEEPKQEEAPEEEPEASWDDEPVETKVEEDYSWVSDLIGEEIKTKDEAKAKVTELKTKLKELSDKPLEGLPDELKEVIEVAKTGDWKDYLASQLIDYDKLNPLEEFERDFFKRAQNNPKYFTEGQFDPQKVHDAIDAIPDVQRELWGQQIIDAEKQLAERQRVALKAKAEEKRTAAEKSLAQSAKQLSEILPLESYGIKFEPRHTTEIYDGIVSSKLTKKHLGVTYDDLVRSGANMRAITRTITLAEKGEKMIAHKSKSSEVKAKKELLTKTQNIQLNSSGADLKPETPEEKPKTAVDILKEHYAQNRKGL